MIANTITLIRLILTFVVIVILGKHPNLNIACMTTNAAQPTGARHTCTHKIRSP